MTKNYGELMLISNQNKWTIDAILQHMSLYPPTENLCVMRRQNHNTQSSEYIIIYQDELYIASTTPEEILHILQDKYKINNYLQGKYPQDSGGTTICQLKKYSEKLYANVNMLFKDKLPTDLQISFEIIKLLIMNSNLNLIHNKTTYQHLHHLSRKRKLKKLYNEA